MQTSPVYVLVKACGLYTTSWTSNRSWDQLMVFAVIEQAQTHYCVSILTKWQSKMFLVYEGRPAAS